MHVNKTETAPHEFVPFDEIQDLVVIGLRRNRQGMKKRDDFLSVSQVPAGEFPDHKRMNQDLFQVEKLREPFGWRSQMVDPVRMPMSSGQQGRLWPIGPPVCAPLNKSLVERPVAVLFFHLTGRVPILSLAPFSIQGGCHE